LIFETIFAASSVSSPEWTAWSIQHNAVWADIFGFDDGKATKIIALKVRRLLYDEIKRMDTFGNFKGARILGYCLHVLGLTLMDRHKGFRREFHPAAGCGDRLDEGKLQKTVVRYSKGCEGMSSGLNLVRE